MPTFLPQTLLLSDNDTRIYYTDTGLHPSFNDYTTVVIVHGLGFNGHGFERLHGYAHEHGLRLVIINRRQYPGSSSYTPQEVASLSDSDYVFDHLSLTLSNFLVAFIESAGIPPKNAEGGGGLAVLGWSIGCSPTLSLLGAYIPPDKQLALAPYLRNLILYDPPSFPFGLEFDASNQDSNVYNPFLDPQLDTPEALAHGFKDWIASYHSPPPPNWDGSIEHLRAEIKFTDEMISWPDAELMNIYSPEVAFVVDAPLLSPEMGPFAKEIARRCLYDESLTQRLLPDVHVTHIACNRSIWNCVWTSFELKRMYTEKLNRGERVRPTRFFMVEQANHFFHHADPQGFLRTIQEGLSLYESSSLSM